MAGDDAHVRTEILRQFNPLRVEAAAGGRAVSELLTAAERAEARRREEAKRKADEQARHEREAAAARAQYLGSLVGREEELWRQIEPLIETKRPKDYDQAVQLLKDLHDLADRQQSPDAFEARFAPLRERYAKRSSLLERLDRAGLSA